MNDTGRRPGPDDGSAGRPASPPELATVDQSTLRPTERRFGEGLPTDGPNDQGSTPLRVARPTDPGSTPGIDQTVAPDGAEEIAHRARGVPVSLRVEDDQPAEIKEVDDGDDDEDAGHQGAEREP